MNVNLQSHLSRFIASLPGFGTDRAAAAASDADEVGSTESVVQPVASYESDEVDAVTAEPQTFRMSELSLFQRAVARWREPQTIEHIFAASGVGAARVRHLGPAAVALAETDVRSLRVDFLVIFYIQRMQWAFAGLVDAEVDCAHARSMSPLSRRGRLQADPEYRQHLTQTLPLDPYRASSIFHALLEPKEQTQRGFSGLIREICDSARARGYKSLALPDTVFALAFLSDVNDKTVIELLKIEAQQDTLHPLQIVIGLADPTRADDMLRLKNLAI